MFKSLACRCLILNSSFARVAQDRDCQTAAARMKFVTYTLVAYGLDFGKLGSRCMGWTRNISPFEIMYMYVYCPEIFGIEVL